MSAFLDRALAGEVIVAIGQIDRDARRRAPQTTQRTF